MIRVALACLVTLVFCSDAQGTGPGCGDIEFNEDGTVSRWRGCNGAEVGNAQGGLKITPPGHASWKPASTGASLDLVWIDESEPIQLDFAGTDWFSSNIGDGLAAMVYGYSKVFRPSGNKLVLHVRHNLIVLSVEGGDFRPLDDALLITPGSKVNVSLMPAASPALEDPDLRAVMYSDLWAVFAWLSQLVEYLLFILAPYVSVVGAIVVFVVFLRVLLYPLNSWGRKQQLKFVELQSQLGQRLAEVRKNYQGAARSAQTVKVYEELGISPLSGLKGSVPLLVQLPILVAMFSVSTESSLFCSIEFLWIEDLALPDRLFELGTTLPVLGSSLNILPIVLGCVGWWASRTGNGVMLGGLLLHLAITVLCYSFSATVLLYWILVNLAQAFEGRMINREDRVKKLPV